MNEQQPKSTSSYSYDPLKIKDEGSDQMRFELGDTEISGGSQTCALCDEEYKVLIEQESSWKKAKKACLKAILSRFAHEVDFSIDGMSFQLSQRYDRWKAEYEKLVKSDQLPSVDPAVFGKDGQGDHYFYYGMCDNPLAE